MDDPYTILGREIRALEETVADMPDGNTAALNLYEHKEAERQKEYDRAAAWAEKQLPLMLERVDTDTIQCAIAKLEPEEWNALAEDLGNGPMRNYEHAGLVLREALERYLFDSAVQEELGEGWDD